MTEEYYQPILESLLSAYMTGSEREVIDRIHSDGFKAGVEGKAELLAACKKMRLSANSPDPQDWADGLSEIDAAILAAEPKEDTP